jgi:hypothetical protein
MPPGVAKGLPVEVQTELQGTAAQFGLEQPLVDRIRQVGAATEGLFQRHGKACDDHQRTSLRDWRLFVCAHSSAVFVAFALLQAIHAVTRFSSVLVPPRLTGILWSQVIRPLRVPQ